MNTKTHTGMHVMIVLTLALAVSVPVLAQPTAGPHEHEPPPPPPPGADEPEVPPEPPLPPELHEQREMMEHARHMRRQVEMLWSEAIDDFVREEIPEAMEHLNRLEREAKVGGLEAEMEFAESAMHFGRAAREMMELREERPEAFETMRRHHQLELQTMALAEEFHHAEDDEARDSLREELEGVLDEAFDVLQRMRELEAEQIERELEEIHELLQARRERRGVIIERRLLELLHGHDPFEW